MFVYTFGRSCIYKAYLKFDPPPTQDLALEIDGELWAYAVGETNRGAGIGMGRSIAADANVFDHAGSEIERVRANARLQFPKDTDDKQDTANYPCGVRMKS